MGEKRQSVDEDDCGYDDVVFARDVHCNSVCTSLPACTVGSILGLLDIRHSRHSPDGGDSVFVVFKDTGWHQKAFCTDRETIKPQCCGGDTLETRGRLTDAWLPLRIHQAQDFREGWRACGGNRV